MAKNIVLEDAHIIFRNFSGREGKYNRAGRRNFCLLIDSELAQDLTREGWNVKTLTPRDEDDEVKHYIQVAVNFDYIPPRVFLVTSKNKTQLTEDTIDSLDFAQIRSVDLTVRPYRWEVSGKTGVKGYLKTMYVAVEEDEFADKYDRDDNLPF